MQDRLVSEEQQRVSIIWLSAHLVWPCHVLSSKQVKDIEAEHPERKGRIIINKATGIGCTEWFLRYIIYKAITDRHWRNSRVCIVTGPRLDLAVRLIQRIKNLFQLSNAIPEQYGDGSNPRFDSRETVVYIGSTKIEAFPSNNQQSLRGLTNIKLDGRRARPTFHVGISSARPAQ